MNAGYFLSRWILSKTRSHAIASVAHSLGYNTAKWVVGVIFSKGSAWLAGAFAARYALRIAYVGGPLAGIIGIAVGAL